MSLIVWTGAEKPTINKVLIPALQRTQTPYLFVDLKEGVLPSFASDDVVLACGTKACDILHAHKIAPKNRKTGSLREEVLRAPNGTKFLTTWDPALTQSDYARLPELQWDVRLAARVVKTGHAAPVVGEYVYVDDLSELIAEIDATYKATGHAVRVAVDLETMGLLPWRKGKRIVSAMFTVKAGKSYILYFEEGEAPKPPHNPFEDIEKMDYWEALWVQINWVLNSKKIKTCGANFKYDLNWLFVKWQMECTNFSFDTLLVGSLVDENRSNSLKLHAKLFTDLGGYDDGMTKKDKEHMELVDKEKLRIYAGGDSDATHQVAEPLKDELLKDKKLADFYVNLLHPAARMFEKVERTGILVDVPYMKELEAELEVEKARIIQEMLSLVPYKLRYKYIDKIEKAEGTGNSPLKTKFLQEFLFTKEGLNLKPLMFTEKSEEPSTAKAHLLMFRDNPDAMKFVEVYEEYNSTEKTLSSFVKGFMKFLCDDNRFHPSYMLFHGNYGNAETESGTDTGRTSLKDPAAQTIPKRTRWTKKLRRAYVAPPGYVILQLDFNQGELRIAACIANEPTMLRAYQDGADLHSITAARINGYELEVFNQLPEDIRDPLRSRGKAGNFGLIYGMGAEGFQDYAWTSYGVKLSAMESHETREGFFELYGGLVTWHEEYRRLAHRYGMVRSPLGRVRHLPLIHSKFRDVSAQAERQAINSPVQSTLSDMMQLAMTLIDREYGDHDIHMFLMTHDSVALYVREDEALEWAKRCKAIMENLPLGMFGWQPQLVFTADAEVGPNLAELKKLKGL